MAIHSKDIILIRIAIMGLLHYLQVHHFSFFVLLPVLAYAFLYLHQHYYKHKITFKGQEYLLIHFYIRMLLKCQLL